MRKSRILASQNLSKIFPKRPRKRCPNKHAIFHRFFLKKCFVARVPTSISYWFFQYKMALGRFSSNSFSHPYSVQNTYQKTSQNEVRAMKKSMLNMCCFLTSIFSGFGLDFGGSWPDFPRFGTSQTMPEGFSWVANALPPTCPASLGRSRAKSGQDLAEPRDVCLECLCFRVLAAMGEVLTEWGGRRCPPPGGFQLIISKQK